MKRNKNKISVKIVKQSQLSDSSGQFNKVILDYVCPNFNYDFQEEIGVIFSCANCGIKLETDYVYDEYAGSIGVCNLK